MIMLAIKHTQRPHAAIYQHEQKPQRSKPTNKKKKHSLVVLEKRMLHVVTQRLHNIRQPVNRCMCVCSFCGVEPYGTWQSTPSRRYGFPNGTRGFQPHTRVLAKKNIHNDPRNDGCSVVLGHPSRIDSFMGPHHSSGCCCFSSTIFVFSFPPQPPLSIAVPRRKSRWSLSMRTPICLAMSNI